MGEIERLLQRAFRSGPARDANRLIDEVRSQLREETASPAVSNYEVVLSGRPWSYLAQEVAPRLAHYLRAKKMSVAHCAPVFLSLFVDDSLHFLHAADLFAELKLREGLSDDDFAALARGWEQTGRRSIAALPAAPQPGGRRS
jgi:hypothetical protein